MTSAGGGNLNLLIDTHCLVWFGAGDPRLPIRVRDCIQDRQNGIFISAVTAWEHADLEKRGRFGGGIGLASLIERLSAEVLSFPAELWQMASALPDLHRDPVDRMLIAHAIYTDLTLVTADKTMREYPVRTFW